MSPQDWIILTVRDSRFCHVTIRNQVYESKVFAPSFVPVEYEEASSLRYLWPVLPKVRHPHEANGLLDEGRHTSGPSGGRRLRLLSDGLRSLGKCCDSKK